MSEPTRTEQVTVDGGDASTSTCGCRPRAADPASCWSRRSSGSAPTSRRWRPGWPARATWSPPPTCSGASRRASRPTTTRPAWPRPSRWSASSTASRAWPTRSPRSGRCRASTRCGAAAGVLGFCLGGTIAHLVAAEGEPDARRVVLRLRRGRVDRPAGRHRLPGALPLRRERRLHPGRAGADRGRRRRGQRSGRPAGARCTRRPATPSTTTRRRCSTTSTRPPRPGRRP